MRKPDLNIKDTEFRGEKGMTVTELKFLEDEGQFEGYASKYGNVDQGGDVVMRGAFTDSLRNGIGHVKMLMHHDTRRPIGRWIDFEDRPEGLWVKGQILREIEDGREAHLMLQNGLLDGLSIGYRTLEDKWDGDVRQLIKLDLKETSVVTFPMNEQCRIESVKDVEGVPTVREIERTLMRDAKLTAQQAKALLAKGYDGLRIDTRDAEKDEGQKELIALMQKLQGTIGS